MNFCIYNEIFHSICITIKSDLIFGCFSTAVRSTSWRGGENEQTGAYNADGSGGPPRLERSKSTQGNLAGREHPDSGPNRRLVGMNANASWDEDNLPEW